VVGVDDLVGILTRRIRDLILEESDAGVPVLVALDGRSGVGKSTLAQAAGDEDLYFDALVPRAAFDPLIDDPRREE
jgi:hypothetical protein